MFQFDVATEAISAFITQDKGSILSQRYIECLIRKVSGYSEGMHML